MTLQAKWEFPIDLALGSSARVKGIDREVRSKLPVALRQFLTSDAGNFVLAMPDGEQEAFASASEKIEAVLAGISTLVVLPSEAEEILTILPRERLKWTKDGRLESAGTRTVKMRGRSKSVTFHVHDPQHIMAVLDRDLPTRWREEDELEKVENRMRAVRQAALTKARKGFATEPAEKLKSARRPSISSDLEGWKVFESEGLLND